MTIAQQTAPDALRPPAPFPFSVLELGGRLQNTPAEQAVQDMVATARTADASGYHRFWVAEHHASTKTASSFPAVLIAHLATQTARIRVGSGGVMLPNHPPFAVAEQFATLQALTPGRIDLGLGRSMVATVTNRRLVEEALRLDTRLISQFPALIDDLLGFLHHRGPDRNRFHGLTLSPHTATAPEVHILGASEDSARIAAERGLPFAYGYHLGRSKCRPQAAARYRAAFDPGPDGARPHLIVSVNAVCAATDEEAADQALSTAAYRVDTAEETAQKGPLSPVRANFLARRALTELNVVHGSPATVNARLEAIAAELGADEIMVVPYELTGAGRCRTLRLTASARQSQGAAAAAASGAGAGVGVGAGRGTARAQG